jgi:hypothetical protein
MNHLTVTLAFVLACVLAVGCSSPQEFVEPVVPPRPGPMQIDPEPRDVLQAPLVSTSWEDSVLQIIKLQHPVAKKCGSGTPIACTFDHEALTWNTYILTAKHVVEPYNEGWEVYYGGEGRFGGLAVVVALHEHEDIAIVRVPSPAPTMVVPIERSPLALAQAVFAVGYPNCMRRVITAGFVGETGSASAAVFPGNSGGPVLTQKGRLVGVVRAIGLGPKNLLGERIMVTHDMLFSPLVHYLDWVLECLNNQ